MEEHILDLGKRHWSSSRFGLTLIGTWVQLSTGWRPCIAVIRANHPEFKPCVIPLDNAWRWHPRLGDPYPRAEAMLLRLGIDPFNQDNVHKLIGFIHDRMHDLVTMPPRPPDAQHHAAPVAEVTFDTELLGKTEAEI